MNSEQHLIGMDAETSMREQTELELRRQEQTSQSFGQRLQERAKQNNELIFESKSRSSYNIIG